MGSSFQVLSFLPFLKVIGGQVAVWIIKCTFTSGKREVCGRLSLINFSYGSSCYAFKEFVKAVTENGSVYLLLLQNTWIFRLSWKYCLHSFNPNELDIFYGPYYREALGEGYDKDIAFASALETFGGGQDDPISVSFGGISTSFFSPGFVSMTRGRKLFCWTNCCVLKSF